MVVGLVAYFARVPYAVARLVLLVRGFILVRELEDFVVSSGGGVRPREGIVVTLLFEVPVSLIAEAVGKEGCKVVTMCFSCRGLVLGRIVRIG